MSVQPVVFRSAIRNLMLSFPEEQFGMGKNAKGEPAAFRNLHFNEGMVSVDPEAQGPLLERLRAHSGLGEEFWEESAADTRATMAMGGEPIASPPEGGLNDDDQSDLDMLSRFSVQLPPTAGPKAIEAINRIIDRFNILGIPKPTEELTIRRVRARIIEVLGVLEDNSLWSGDDGRGNTE